MIYKLTLTLTGEELARSLELEGHEVVDDRSEFDIIGALRDFGLVEGGSYAAEPE